MAVPIRNIYYLLCYAWEKLGALDTTDAGALTGDRVENLLAKVLVDGVTHLMRRGLDRGYLAVDQEGRQLRGKVLLVETAQRLLLQQGRVACRSDELSHDVPHNRVIKAAMRELAAVASVDSELSWGLKDLCRRMHDVSDIELNPTAFRPVQLGQNLVRYGFLIESARLVSGSLLPEANGRGTRFRSFTADEKQMGALFEAFVWNFLDREQRTFAVTSPHVEWKTGVGPQSDVKWLPAMKTDIVLTRPGQTVVIEAKCYAEALQSHFHGSVKLRSAHLYQLLAYLTHFPRTAGRPPSGMLLYAGLGPGEPLDYELDGLTVLIRNLNLDQPWEAIHADLLGLARELSSWPVAIGA
jgi:5-methylcytosine-specific restriction enzyme subunit McrC